MKKQIISFLAIFLALVMVLASCGKETASKSNNPKSKSTTQSKKKDKSSNEEDEYLDDDFDDEDYDFDDDYSDDDYDFENAETVDFSASYIVYPSNASKEVQYLVDTFSQYLSQRYYLPNNYDDSTTASAGTNEIIIGNTNRSESSASLNKLVANRKNCDADFIISVENGNITINATSNYALNNALKYFKDTFCKDENTAEIPKNYYYHHKAKLSASSASLLGNDIEKYTVVTRRDMSYIYSRYVDTLVNYICSATGIELPVVDDKEKESEYEILIGKTSRSQSNVKYDKNADYSITQSGKKAVISGGSDLALSDAIRAFVTKIKESVTDSQKITVSSLNEKGTYSPKSNEYQLVWGDEFDGDSLDLKKWTRVLQTDTAWDGAVCNRTGTTDNSYLEDGKLIIKGFKDADGNYASAKLSTANSMYFNYGYFEIRTKLPDGAGLWPGFWTQPTTPIYPEIDVFEMFGESDKIQFTLHKWWSSTTGGSGHESVQDAYYPDTTKIVRLKNGEKFSDTFHTIGCEWTPEHIALYVDGFKYTEVNIQAEGMDVFHQPISVILSLAVGLTGVMRPDETTVWPALYEIDYFRLYKIPGVGSIVTK